MELELLNLLLVLIAAWLGGALAFRLGYPPILGELIAGIVFGPALINIISATETTSILAEVGVLLMMLYIGMEINFRDLGKASWAGFLAAIGGFVVPFAAGYYTVIAFGGTPMGGLFVAIAVGVTSLATKSRILVDLNLLNTRIAHVLMAGALISDTLALIIFAGIVSFADAGSLEFMQVLIVAGKAILFFVVSGLIGIYALPYLGKQLEKGGISDRTLYFTIMLIIAIGFAELAELAGLHHILGAFLAGLFLRDSVFNRRLSKELNKVFYDISIGFLAPIFFVTAGFEVTFDVFQTDLLLLISILVVATLGKILGTALFYLPSGNGWREGITVGTGMNGRGAVEIIIAGIGLSMGIITSEIFSILVFMAIFTTATVPVFLTWCTNWLRKRGELVLSDSEKKGTLIIGAGNISMYIAKKLSSEGSVIIIDSNYHQCAKARDKGLKCLNDNGLKEDVLTEAGAPQTKEFLAFTYNSEINILAAQLAREVFSIPDVHVLLTPDDKAANLELLEPINATTIFAQKVNVLQWDSRIEKGDYEEKEVEIQESVSTRTWYKKMRQDQAAILPVLTRDSEGRLGIFHYGADLQPGDVVVYLQ